MDYKIIRDKDLCMWYKSMSISECNPYYILCRVYCDGFNAECSRYLSPSSLEKTINEGGGVVCQKKS